MSQRAPSPVSNEAGEKNDDLPFLVLHNGSEEGEAEENERKECERCIFIKANQPSDRA